MRESISSSAAGNQRYIQLGRVVLVWIGQMLALWNSGCYHYNDPNDTSIVLVLYMDRSVRFVCANCDDLFSDQAGWCAWPQI